MSAPISAGWDHIGPYLVLDGAVRRLDAAEAFAVRDAFHGPPARPAPPAPVSEGEGEVLPVHTTATTEPARVRGSVRPEDLDLLPAARQWCERLSVSRERVAAILTDPAQEWTSRSRTGDAAVASDGEIAVVIGLEDDSVLAVMTHGRAVTIRDRPAVRPRGRGGAGRRYPTTMQELFAVLEKRGCAVERTSNHVHVHHAGAMGVLPSTPSDHRSLMNAIKTLEQALDLDLTRDGA